MPYARVKNELPIIPGYASGDFISISDAFPGAPVNKMQVGIIDQNGVTGCTVACNGINQWDEEWESGDINIQDGQKRINPSRVRTVNFIPVKPNTTYYSKNGNTNTIICFYDINKGWVSGESGVGYVVGTNRTFTTPEWCHFIMFYSAVTSYDNVSINYPATYTDYHAYVGEQYDLDWSSEVGSVTYGSFVIDKDGAVTITSGGSHTTIADKAPLKTHSGVNYIICTAGTIQNITYIRRNDT